MGDFRVNKINSEEERNQSYSNILRDIEAFEFMLNNQLISSGDKTIGAEQEMVIIDNNGSPVSLSHEILDSIDDDHFTNELATFNLEVNLDPLPLHGQCFSLMENHLKNFLTKANRIAESHGGNIFLTGILPTIVREHLDYAYMTPEKRYKILSEELRKIRKKDFTIYLQGVDDLQMNMKDILIESCNTSYQVHLQINAYEFHKYHNWSQMIAGPVLASAVNSPLLFGKELWNETRIAIFKQSLDTRNFNTHYREKSPRVYFGHDWQEGNASQIWKNDLSMFPLVFRGSGGDDPFDEISRDIIPSLDSVRLHSGTTYTWNRMCYGVFDNVAHLRIECRYLPSGPTPVDEIANQAFWTGMMKAIPEENNFWKDEDFRAYKQNFYSAARFGLNSVMYYRGKYYPTKTLILDHFLPASERGLKSMGVDDLDIRKYLAIIEQRVLNEQTGAEWNIRNFRKLKKSIKPALASKILVQEGLKRQKENIPVGEWTQVVTQPLSHYYSSISEKLTVYDMMSTDVYTVNKNANVALALGIMTFKSINHIIVEDDDHRFIGLIDKASLVNIESPKDTIIKNLELSNTCFVPTTTLLSEARKKLKESIYEALIIIENQKVVGILTTKDL